MNHTGYDRVDGADSLRCIVRRASGLSMSLCEELAVVAQGCIGGYSDDRPVSACLVRSRLTNALTGAPPVLVLARLGEELAGWCAVRRPEPGESWARLWGPLVRPAARRAGVGALLLQAAVAAVDWPLRTTDVPADRPCGAGFFLRAGWTAVHDVTVLHGAPATTGPDAIGAEAVEHLEEYVAAAARRFGGHEAQFAAATLRRWRDDERFRLENLLLDPATGSLLLALAQRAGASSELLLAEVWAAPEARRQLIRTAHAAAGQQGLARVRAVTRGDPVDFVACGMRIAGVCRTFALPRRG